VAIQDDERSVDLLENVIDSAPNAMLVVDLDGSITMANAMVSDLFGWNPSSLLGRPIEELVPEAFRELNQVHREDYLEAPSPRPGERRHLSGLRADGSTFLVEVALNTVRVRGKTRVIAVVRDVTARVDAENDLRREQTWKALLEDRARIARDLHDGVIQEIFSAGLKLAAVESMVSGRGAEIVGDVIKRLDACIQELRDAVFSLHTRFGASNFPSLVHDAATVLGFEPVLVLTGDVALLDDELSAELDAVIRECLTNVGRHARATKASVNVHIDHDEVLVRISDDGVGPSHLADDPGTGLRSMSERAKRRQGEFAVSSTAHGGTTVEWRVPTAPS
jgi:two-component system, NarL family, sensor histidine kinase DevS